MSEPRVAVIVLNYNGKDVTLETLASLVELDYPSYDVVVVDNGSTDGSFDTVAAAYPSVIQLRVEDNQGISYGLNHGIAYALEREYAYFLVCNNDIEVAPDALAHMVRAMEADATLGCVGPKTFYHGDRTRLWSTGGILRFQESVTRERGMNELDHGQYDQDGEVDYVNGCAMLKRREAVEAAGLWDPTYYLGIEDADWCMRMKQHGYRCYYVHQALVWHMVSASIGVYKPGRTFHTGRSQAIFVRKYARPWQWLSFLAFYAASVPVAYVREWVKERNQAAALAKLRGVMKGLRVPLAAPPTADWRPLRRS
jgi:GT2 family glycosyltransferase